MGRNWVALDSNEEFLCLSAQAAELTIWVEQQAAAPKAATAAGRRKPATASMRAAHPGTPLVDLEKTESHSPVTREEFDHLFWCGHEAGEAGEDDEACRSGREKLFTPVSGVALLAVLWSVMLMCSCISKLACRPGSNSRQSTGRPAPHTHNGGKRSEPDTRSTAYVMLACRPVVRVLMCRSDTWTMQAWDKFSAQQADAEVDPVDRTTSRKDRLAQVKEECNKRKLDARQVSMCSCWGPPHSHTTQKLAAV